MGCTTFLKRLFSDTVKINKKIRNEPLNGICSFLSDFVGFCRYGVLVDVFGVRYAENLVVSASLMSKP
jgi:hypothetical protein